MDGKTDRSPTVTAEYLMLPHLWRRQLAWMRILLSAGCAAAFWIYPVALHPLVPALYGVYAVLSASVLFSRKAEQTSYGLTGLITAAAAFLICASHPSPHLLWLSFLFYFYVLLFAALLYEWRKVVWVVLLCLIYMPLRRPPQLMSLWPILVMAGTMAGILAVQKREFQERLSAAFRRAVLSRSEAETARTTERQRIAADFHDGPLQSFISFQMRLELIRKLMGRDQESAMQELLQLQGICRDQVTELRNFVRSMRPAELDVASWNGALRQVVKAFESDTGIFVNLQNKDFQTPTEPDAAMEILQVVREALHNVQKHSRASRVVLTLTNTDHKIDISIEDDGSGFLFSGAYTLEELELLRLGPSSIKRRVRGLGGDLTIESRPGRGATLRVRVPV